MARAGGDHRPGGLAGGLSARLLVLTVFFVMLSEVLIYVPSIANFRHNYLQARLIDANLAAMALRATPDNVVSVELAQELLEAADVRMVVLKRRKTRSLLLADDMPPKVDASFDLRRASPWMLIMQAFEALIEGERTLLVVGAFPDGSEGFVEVVLDEAALRDAMLDYSTNILQLSIVISLVTASLVFLSLHVLFVRPMRDITASMIRFREGPEDAGNVVPPSNRGDEIGAARRELAQMQREIRAALRQKTHLAALGSAVAKINHDLRNMLATAHLVSDRLASSDDPDVRRATPTLVAALDRAVALCSATLDYGKAEAPAPRTETFRLRALVDELMEHVGLDEASNIAWLNAVAPDIEIAGDREQLFRVFLNISRNAMAALSPSPPRPTEPGGGSSSPTTVRDCRERRSTTCSRPSPARRARAARASASQTPASWSARMVASWSWSRATRKARPSASRFPPADRGHPRKEEICVGIPTNTWPSTTCVCAPRSTCWRGSRARRRARWSISAAGQGTSPRYCGDVSRKPG